ncbi:unnamed protein product, partial [Brenthis ino]
MALFIKVEKVTDEYVTRHNYIWKPESNLRFTWAADLVTFSEVHSASGDDPVKTIGLLRVLEVRTAHEVGESLNHLRVSREQVVCLIACPNDKKYEI